jgi:hypothetical protein
MAKEKDYKEKIIKAVTDIQDLFNKENTLKSHEDRILRMTGEQLAFYINFKDGINDVQKWITENRIIQGRKFSYEDAHIAMMLGDKDKKLETAPRPYLRQCINDIAREKSIIKCRQSEYTETEINENIYLCASRPFTNVRHIFPTAGMALQIGKEKISPAIEQSPKIAEQVQKPYNVTSKEFKNGSFYTIDSSWTDYQGRGPSSDKLTFDEYEIQNPQIEEIFSESTSHSEIGRRTRISTPKFPGSGIDLMFNRGSKFEWHITCPKCNKEQIMTFPDNIINFFDITSPGEIGSEAYTKKIDRVYIGCKHCGTYIDRTSQHYLTNSRWIAGNTTLIPIKTSYRVSYFMLPWKTGKEILFKYHQFRFVNQFFNEVIGMAYVTKEAEISREIFEQCQDLSFTNQFGKIGNLKNVSVGVDWGVVSWAVVRASSQYDNKMSRIIYIERIDEQSLMNNGFIGNQTDHAIRVSQIADYFNARIIINDANGIGVDRNSYLIRKYPTRAYGCFYDTAENQKQKRNIKLIIPQWNESKRIVTVSRLETFKMLLQEYEARKVTIPRLDPMVETFIEHHSNLVIERYEDETTGAIVEEVGKIGPDHLAHADVYAKIGFDKMVNTLRETSIGVIDAQDKQNNDILDDIYNEVYNNEHGLK